MKQWETKIIGIGSTALLHELIKTIDNHLQYIKDKTTASTCENLFTTHTFNYQTISLHIGNFLLVLFYKYLTLLLGQALLGRKILVDQYTTSLSKISSLAYDNSKFLWDLVGHRALLDPAKALSNHPPWSGYTFSKSHCS